MFCCSNVVHFIIRMQSKHVDVNVNNYFHSFEARDLHFESYIFSFTVNQGKQSTENYFFAIFRF